MSTPLVCKRIIANGVRIADATASPPPFDLITICVPTPTIDGKFVATHVTDAIATAASFVRHDHFSVIVVRSTVLPGTMAALVEPLVGKLVPRASVGIAYRPSFARERQAEVDEREPRLVVVGYDGHEATRRALEPLLESFRGPVHWTGYAAAELVKYGSNLFNALKISYFNAFGAWAAASSDDPQRLAEIVAQASEANWNPGYGLRSVGLPFGGDCLPKDLDAFLDFLSGAGAPHTALLSAIREVNDSLGGPAHAVERRD